MKNIVTLEKLRYRKWSVKQNRHVTKLRGDGYSVKINNTHMLCLSSECYPNLAKTIDQDIYFYGFKDCGRFIDRHTWKNAYRVLRRELKRIMRGN